MATGYVMIGFRRLPIRARLTVGFATAIVVILVAFGLALYATMSATLLDEIDTGLRSRAATIEAGLPNPLRLATPTPGLVESHEAFAQVLDRDGSVLETSSAFPDALLTPAQVRAVDRPALSDRRLPGVASGARLLAVPVTKGSQRYVVVVGSSLSDRADALHLVQRLFLFGGPIALVLACVAGWMVAGVGLRPVERMRRQAAEISATDNVQRLSVPDSHDELERLARTLNEMLERIDAAVRAERRFVNNASHELRTPLTALKAELDLARSRPRTAAELSDVVDSASDETDRLVRMAGDLLLLARAHDGSLPVEREETSLRELLSTSAGRFATRAAHEHVVIEVDAPSGRVHLDPRRVGQAVDNLLDNGLRYAETLVVLRGTVEPDRITITVTDDGPGFPPGFADRAFVPFEQGPAYDGQNGSSGSEGAGLGLTIVAMIAASHQGAASAANAPGGGGAVTLTLAATG